MDDKTHQILGTTFRPSQAKVGNEDLEPWLYRLLTPSINFVFFELTIEKHQVVLFQIAPAFRQPLQFKQQEFIRIGSNKKKFKDYPEKERELWKSFNITQFENVIARERLTDDEILKLLNYPAYFELLNLPLPERKKGILESLEADNMIAQSISGLWSVTNLGAILFAKDIEDFISLIRRAIRVIQYKGRNKIETIREQAGKKGYAAGFENLITYITALLPENEVIEQAIRTKVSMYPEIAVRELIVNAIIHQDFTITGTGPMIEIFTDRIEITNPGIPLIETNRFLDNPPRSRNEGWLLLCVELGYVKRGAVVLIKSFFKQNFTSFLHLFLKLLLIIPAAFFLRTSH